MWNYALLTALITLPTTAIAWWYLNTQQTQRQAEHNRLKQQRRRNADPQPMEPATALARTHRRNPTRTIGQPPQRQRRIRRAPSMLDTNKQPDHPEALALATQTADTTLQDANDQLRRELADTIEQLTQTRTELALLRDNLEAANRQVVLGETEPIITALQERGEPLPLDSLAHEAGLQTKSPDFANLLLKCIHWGFVRVCTDTEGDHFYYLKGHQLPRGFGASRNDQLRADADTGILLDTIDQETLASALGTYKNAPAQTNAE